MTEKLKVIVFALLCLGFTHIGYAQNYTSSTLKCPDYKFTRNLIVGSKGEDVRLIQKILNLDYRTQIAQSGLGSKGLETDKYGIATREAVKKFQALFIELIGVADGRFNNRTLTVMNSVCQGPYFTGKSGSVFDLKATTTAITTVDKIGPVITLSAPSIGYTDEAFRVWIVANEPIKAFDLSSFIILGGASISDLRKENPTTYKALVKPGKNTTHTISLQIEADAVQDLLGNVNTSASNELLLTLSPRPEGPDVTAPTATLSSGSLGVMTLKEDATVSPVNLTLSFSEPVLGGVNLSDFVVRGSISVTDLKQLDQSTYSLVVNATQNTDRSTGTVQLPANLVTDRVGNKNLISNEYQFTVLKLPVATTTAQTNYAPGYTGGGSDSGSSNSSDPMQTLMMLMAGSQALSGLTSLLGKNPFSSLAGSTAGQTTGNSAIADAVSAGGKNFGGTIAPSGACVCSPATTGILTKVSGASPIPGIYVITGIPVGEYTGIALPAPQICGKRFAVDGPKYRDPCADAGGQRVGMCCGPTLDSTGKPVVGRLLKVN